MEKKTSKSRDLFFSSDKKWQTRGRQIIREWKKSDYSQTVKHALLNEAPDNTEAAILYSHMVQSDAGNDRIRCAASFEAGMNFQLYKNSITAIVRTLRAETTKRSFTGPLEVASSTMLRIIAIDNDEIGHPHNGALIEFGYLLINLVDAFQLEHPDLDASDLERCAGNVLNRYIKNLKEQL
jgi:hypothetical protein